MDKGFNSAKQSFFDALSGFRPKSFGEYNTVAGQAAKGVLTNCGITGVEYDIDIPSLFDEDIFMGGSLFGSKGDVVTRFKYKLDRDGYIEFLTFSESELTDAEKSCAEIVLRQLYYVLDLLTARLLFEKLIITDYRTGLANMEAYTRFVNKIIAEGRLKDYTALYFNVRNFRSIHRSLTYEEGNEVLKKYGKIVSAAVTKNELVTFLGSEFFVALILNENRDYFFDLIQNMVITYQKDGKPITFNFDAKIGAAELSDEGTAGDVIMHIGTAYQAASETGGYMSYYDNRISNMISERRVILSRFYRAIHEGAFFPMYQPKVDVKRHIIIGAEALVRWRDGDKIIMPGDFIPVLEKDGCICQLDFYMLEEVCKLQRKLIDEGVDLVKISINFSKRHLANNKLVEEITEVIDRYAVPREYIVIELTESEDYRNQEVMRAIVNDLSMQGIKTSIDDFGVGYSSLGMLKTLRFDELKIDKSFVPVALDSGSEKSLLMFNGIVNLAKSLGFAIVVEGVETLEQLQLIKSAGCDVVQGYIFDKPLPENEFVDRIKKRVYILNKEGL